MSLCAPDEQIQTCNGEVETDYNVTQHMLQQLPTDQGGDESGNASYAKLQNDKVAVTN